MSQLLLWFGVELIAYPLAIMLGVQVDEDHMGASQLEDHEIRDNHWSVMAAGGRWTDEL